MRPGKTIFRQRTRQNCYQLRTYTSATLRAYYSGAGGVAPASDPLKAFSHLRFCMQRNTYTSTCRIECMAVNSTLQNNMSLQRIKGLRQLLTFRDPGLAIPTVAAVLRLEEVQSAPSILALCDMIIPIRPPAAMKEYCLLEFQGEIVHEAGLKEGFTIGALSPHDAKKDTVCLQVGYHRLEGVKMPLKKPMVVLVREGQDDGQGASSQEDACFEAQAVIRCKFIFKNRPKALISHA